MCCCINKSQSLAGWRIVQLLVIIIIIIIISHAWPAGVVVPFICSGRWQCHMQHQQRFLYRSPLDGPRWVSVTQVDASIVSCCRDDILLVYRLPVILPFGPAPSPVVDGHVQRPSCSIFECDWRDPPVMLVTSALVTWWNQRILRMHCWHVASDVSVVHVSHPYSRTERTSELYDSQLGCQAETGLLLHIWQHEYDNGTVAKFIFP